MKFRKYTICNPKPFFRLNGLQTWNFSISHKLVFCFINVTWLFLIWRGHEWTYLGHESSFSWSQGNILKLLSYGSRYLFCGHEILKWKLLYFKVSETMGNQLNQLTIVATRSMEMSDNIILHFNPAML